MPEYNIPFYKYIQLRHFFNTNKPTSRWHRDYTLFELLCNCAEPQGHLISTIYTLLFSKHKVKENKIVRQWELDLSLNLTPTDWERIFTLMY